MAHGVHAVFRAIHGHPVGRVGAVVWPPFSARSHPAPTAETAAGRPDSRFELATALAVGYRTVFNDKADAVGAQLFKVSSFWRRPRLSADERVRRRVRVSPSSFCPCKTRPSRRRRETGTGRRCHRGCGCAREERDSKRPPFLRPAVRDSTGSNGVSVSPYMIRRIRMFTPHGTPPFNWAISQLPLLDAACRVANSGVGCVRGPSAAFWWRCSWLKAERGLFPGP